VRGQGALDHGEGRRGPVNSKTAPHSLSGVPEVTDRGPRRPGGRLGRGAVSTRALAVFLVCIGASLLVAVPTRAFPDSIAPWAELRSYGAGDLVVADFDADGRSDLAWTNQPGQRLYLHLNGPQGFSVDAPLFITLPSPGDLEAKDIDRDGRTDLAVVQEGGVGVYTNLLGIRYTATQVLQVVGASEAKAGDLDGDGRPDLAVLTPDSLLVFLQDPSGGFPVGPSFTLPAAGFTAMTTGDLGGDGIDDVVLVAPSAVIVHSFAGMSVATREHALGSAREAVAVAVGDVDRDGSADLTIGRSTAGTDSGVVEFWHQSPVAGTFEPAGVLEGDLTGHFLLTDLNDDEDLDVAAIRQDGGINLYFQIGGGEFSSDTPLRIDGADPGAEEVLASGDLNGDSYADLVLRGERSASLELFVQDDLPPRVLLPIPSGLVVDEGTTVRDVHDLRAFLHDDHDRLRFTIEQVYGVGVEPVLDGPSLGFRVPSGIVGTVVFRVRGWDGVPGHPEAVSNEFSVIANEVPRITSAPPQVLQAGQELRYRVGFTDGYPPGERNQLVLVDAPEGARASGTTLIWIPSEAQEGLHGITLRVQDSHGALSEPQFFVVDVRVPPSPPTISPVAIVAAGALSSVALVGGAVAVNENARWSFLLFFLPLYSKIRREDVLDHFVRGQIFGYIRANPGEHYNAIKAALHLTNGSLAHHLKTLEREDFVKSRRFGLYRRFYPRDFRIPESDAFVLNDIQRTVLRIVHGQPGLSQKELSMLLGLTPPTVNYHINLLAANGYVRVLHAGRKTQLFAESAPPALGTV